MATPRTHRRASPPFWLPVLAGLPLGVCLLLMAVPILGYGNASMARTLYLLAFVLWVAPLTVLQRWLWRRCTPGWVMVPALLVLTYLMALATRLISLRLQTALYAHLPKPELDWTLLFRGLEGAWLVLVAFCAIHAVVAYYAELRHEQAEHVEARALARDAELRALRYQLHPHFLFNTLNAISALVAEGRGAEARQMLARLGDFFRAVLDSHHGHEVALAEEIAMTETYLDIERARLGSRLRLSWRLGADVLDAQVPFLLLQPLVENAIRHGIAPRSAPGLLDVDIGKHDGGLRIRVGNDLPSPAEAQCAGPVEREPVGLQNVRDRLARLYPGQAELVAGLRDDGRYHVELRLPLRAKPGSCA